MEITLEKVDKVIERTHVSYADAKAALELNDGDILNAIIYIESLKKAKVENEINEKSETVEELKVWLKDLIEKGNVTRIKIRKDEKVIVDVPVNAGIAAGVIAIILPPVLAFIVIAAVVTKITIEITKEDGSVEVVNKYISKATEDLKDTALNVKDKALDIKDRLKDKVNEIKKDKFDLDGFNTHNTSKEYKAKTMDENSFTYTVKFEEDKKE